MAEVLDTFELKHVSTTYSEDGEGNVLTHFNCRGNAAGFGLVYDTAVFYNLKSNAESGSLKRIGHAFARNGSYVLGHGKGTWERVPGEHAWKTEVIFELDGPRIRSVGELRLDSETHSGINYSVDD
jgi:hypothetical protein